MRHYDDHTSCEAPLAIGAAVRFLPDPNHVEPKP
jgi:hypothetical protein